MPSTYPAVTRCQTPSPLGTLTVAAQDGMLVGVWFDGQQHQPDTSEWTTDPRHPVLLAACKQLAQYFKRERRVFDLPLRPLAGTAFQRSVWDALRAIPLGTTTTYGAVAQRIGRPQAVRAVGAAVGRNPWGIVVPCHRVVGSQGALTGYAGGIDRKRFLLELEHVACK